MAPSLFYIHWKRCTCCCLIKKKRHKRYWRAVKYPQRFNGSGQKKHYTNSTNFISTVLLWVFEKCVKRYSLRLYWNSSCHFWTSESLVCHLQNIHIYWYLLCFRPFTKHRLGSLASAGKRFLIQSLSCFFYHRPQIDLRQQMFYTLRCVKWGPALHYKVR